MGFFKKLKFWRKKNKGADFKKRIQELEKKNAELQDFALCLKQTVTNLEKDRGERIEIHNKQQEELQAVRVKNNKLQNKCVTVIEIEVDLRLELERAKIINDKLNEYWKLAMKDCEEEKEILVTRNKELQIELEKLQVANDNTNKHLESKMKDLEEEKEMLINRNKDLQNELEQLQIANNNLNKHLESKMKDWEEEKETLINGNKELQKQLEAMKPVQNLNFVGGSSQRQQGCQCELHTADDGKLSLEKFKFIRRLGAGGFGTVVLAKGNLLGGPEELYALKAVKKRGVTCRNVCYIMVEKEALMLTSGHPFITTMYCCFQNKEHLFFVMEFMSGGNLRDQLDKVMFFSEKRTQFYAAEITLAVKFLHHHGILHRDLKLENVLVGSDGHCKIADFGLSKLGLFHYCKTTSFCGTRYCMAPEILKNLPYDQAVDWWAVGIMIYQMIAGHPPFGYKEEEDWDEDNAECNLEQKILNAEVDIPKHMSPCAASIVLQLLAKDPKLRLGASGSDFTIQQHSFFRGIDWLALQEKRVEPPEEEKFAGNTEEGFSKVLKIDNSPGIINLNLFQGFSFINYGAKRG
jgi:serine/threonine protein kinase